MLLPPHYFLPYFLFRLFLLPHILQIQAGLSGPSADAEPDTGNPSQQAEVGLGHYRVYYGDTLRSISKKFGISTAQIQKWNRLMNGEQVWPGQVLVVRSNITKKRDNPAPKLQPVSLRASSQ